MKQAIAIGLTMLIAATGALAAELDDEPGATRILVTFADPGMSNATRAGPPGPGYRRLSSKYLVSVGVKRSANRLAQEFQLQTLDEWPIISLKVHCLVFGVAENVLLDDLLERLRERPEVESAQLLNEFEVNRAANATGDDPYVNLQHNLDTLELSQAHRWSMGVGTNVTIIDTGADLNHPELESQISHHEDFVLQKDADFSADAHGTAVAGVIGAAANNGVGVVGVAPSTSLSILKACWYRKSAARAVCNTFTLAKALSHALDSQTDVINLSLGGPSDPLLARLTQQALSQGIVVVAAAPDTNPAGFPANVPGVIVVGAIEPASASAAKQQFSFSAPGADILVPVPFGGYDYSSGSSLSAAHVSGIVALLVARQRHLTHAQINALLANSRQDINQSVNACRALAALLHETGCKLPETLSQSL